jgi:hypothetical protein
MGEFFFTTRLIEGEIILPRPPLISWRRPLHFTLKCHAIAAGTQKVLHQASCVCVCEGELHQLLLEIHDGSSVSTVASF